MTLAEFIASFSYEKKYPGFRKDILDLSRRGMLLAGTLGIVLPLAYMGLHAATGRVLVLWSYTDPRMMALWDKLLVIGLSLASLGLSRSEAGPRWGRLVVAGILLVTSIASLLDDVARQDVTFSAGWLGLFMLVAVGIMPYHPWQTFTFSSAVIGVYVLGLRYASVLMDVEPMAPAARHVFFIVIIALICTSVSWLLYTSRYEQYKHADEAEKQKQEAEKQKQEAEKQKQEADKQRQDAEKERQRAEELAAKERQARLRAEQLKEQVEEQAEKLIEMDRLKTRFFANVSHEFRTPLTIILGDLENSLARTDSGIEAGARPQLERMHRNARRLLRLINQLLDLSKLEAGSMQLRAQRGDIVQHLSGIVRAFASYAERKKIDLQFDPDSPAILLYFDPDKIEKMLFNLLSNAFKFTPEGGTIRVRVTETGSEDAGTVEVLVKDTGAGISKDQLDVIFDRFHQVDGAVGRAQEGTGIGLALVKELVELHGGAIHVESDPGFGSAFTVTLRKGSAHFDVEPIEADVSGVQDDSERAPWALYEPAPSELAMAEATPPAEEDLEASGEGDTLLVVDDNADVRAFLRDCLAGAYHVVEARDGQEGLEKARDAVPDLILADVMMPRMDGFALCRSVKADEVLNHVPVILLTALASDESKVEGLETGADDYLFKPFNADELRARVRNLIALRRRLQARFSQEVLIQPSAISVPSADEAFVDRAREVVEEKMGDEDFGVDAFAEALNMSARQLQRKLGALTGKTPTEFIRLMQLKRAAQLLEQGAGRISDIAYEVGFNNPTYFATRFREVFGMSPSAYAKKKS